MTPSSAPSVSSVTSSAPAAPSGAAAPAANSAASAQAEAQDSQDFPQLLDQLLGTAAPTPSTVAQVTPVVATTDAETETDEPLDAAALEAMLEFTSMTPWTAEPVAASTSGAADALSSTGLSAMLPGTSSAAKVLEGLTSLETKTDGADAAQFANLNASATTSKDVAQEVRATVSSDTRGLHTPVGSSEWADELGTRMTWMAERGHQVASLRLSPEHLGPLEVRISIRDDQASVWFGAAHADTRAAIEEALPRLREMFGSQGLNLADTGVFQEAPRDRSQPQTGAGNGDGSASESESNVISIAHRRLGLVDAYA